MGELYRQIYRNSKRERGRKGGRDGGRVTWGGVLRKIDEMVRETKMAGVI